MVIPCKEPFRSAPMYLKGARVTVGDLRFPRTPDTNLSDYHSLAVTLNMWLLNSGGRPMFGWCPLNQPEKPFASRKHTPMRLQGFGSVKTKRKTDVFFAGTLKYTTTTKKKHWLVLRGTESRFVGPRENTYRHVYVYIYTYLYIYTCVYIYIYVNMCVYIMGVPESPKQTEPISSTPPLARCLQGVVHGLVPGIQHQIQRRQGAELLNPPAVNRKTGSKQWLFSFPRSFVVWSIIGV